MTRVGWIVLALILLAAGIFASLLRFGGATPVLPPTVPRPPDGLLVPVEGVGRAQLTDTWGQARSEGRVHHGTDIIAPSGTPVLAVAAGTVEKLFASRLGGTTLYERSPDRRWIYYYAHLSGYALGLHEGEPVRAGELLGYVGDTGDAGAGNFHLHFGLTRAAPDQRWYQGENVNAFPYLRTGRALR